MDNLLFLTQLGSLEILVEENPALARELYRTELGITRSDKTEAAFYMGRFMQRVYSGHMTNTELVKTAALVQTVILNQFDEIELTEVFEKKLELNKCSVLAEMPTTMYGLGVDIAKRVCGIPKESTKSEEKVETVESANETSEEVIESCDALEPADNEEIFFGEVDKADEENPQNEE